MTELAGAELNVELKTNRRPFANFPGVSKHNIVSFNISIFYMPSFVWSSVAKK